MTTSLTATPQQPPTQPAPSLPPAPRVPDPAPVRGPWWPSYIPTQRSPETDVQESPKPEPVTIHEWPEPVANATGLLTVQLHGCGYPPNDGCDCFEDAAEVAAAWAYPLYFGPVTR